MNHHVTDKMRKDWPGFEFIGKPFPAHGYLWIKAKQRTSGRSAYYCYERNMFMMDDTAMLFRQGKGVDLI